MKGKKYIELGRAIMNCPNCQPKTFGISRDVQGEVELSILPCPQHSAEILKLFAKRNAQKTSAKDKSFEIIRS